MGNIFGRHVTNMTTVGVKKRCLLEMGKCSGLEMNGRKNVKPGDQSGLHTEGG